MAPTSENKAGRKGPGRLGCLAICVALAGGVIGIGLLLGRRHDASMTPCERYAATITRALDNCSSGQTRNHSHHIAACERSIDPTPACLERIEALPCAELELGPGAAGDVCRKK